MERAPDSERSQQFASAVAAIDEANSHDPNLIVFDGVERPKELVHADVVERWLCALAPDATEAQILAARAHHLRRWVVGRDQYPSDRAGYLKWRSDQKQRQAEEVAEILADRGYESTVIDNVCRIVAKKARSKDPEVQVHEDALCLTFLELQLDELADRLGDEHTVGVLRRTIKKMSPEGLAVAGTLDLSDRGAALLGRGLESEPTEAGA